MLNWKNMYHTRSYIAREASISYFPIVFWIKIQSLTLKGLRNTVVWGQGQQKIIILKIKTKILRKLLFQGKVFLHGEIENFEEYSLILEFAELIFPILNNYLVKMHWPCPWAMVVQISQIVKTCYKMQHRSIISNDFETKVVNHDVSIIFVCLDLLLYSPIFISKFCNQNLKIPSKFDFRLGFNDFNKIFFCYEFKIWNFIFGLFPYVTYFYVTCSLK